MMARRATATLASLLSLALGSPAAVAHDDPRKATEQRIALAAQLLGDASTAQRVLASGQPRAAGYLDEGRLHHAIAQEALQRGDLVAARRAADSALRLIGQARRLAPDAPARQAAARQRHEQLTAHLERLLEAWERRQPMGEVDDGDRLAAMSLMQTARGLASEGRHEEAVQVLGSAEGHVLTGMNRLLRNAAVREVNYTQRPANDNEAYQLEQRRHQELTDLVRLALDELRPRPDTAALIARFGQASRTLQAQAELQHQAGQLAQALANLRNASLYLERALSAAGVLTPSPVGDSP